MQDRYCLAFEISSVFRFLKRISVFFSDIVDFTAFTDQADPQEVQDVLERYFEETTTIIFEADGIVDKYMGDGILAFFENSR